MKLAYFSPLSPIKSGISEYSEGLLPYLAKYLEIDLVVDNYQPTHPDIQNHYKVIPCSVFPHCASDYDVIMYHFGNNLYHKYMISLVYDYPGIAVLHDTSLFHLIAGIALERGDISYLEREMEYGYGELGVSVARRFWSGIFSECEKFIFSMNQRIIDASRAVVVHSHYDLEEIQTRHPEKQVIQIPMHYGDNHTQMPDSLENIKQKLGLQTEQFVIASFGFITPIKRIPQILHAIAELVRHIPNAIYVLVGETTPSYPLNDLIEKLGIQNHVRITEYVSTTQFNQYLAIADVCINLRYPSAGETSATLIRCFAAGKPTLVSNYRQYAELPDDCCIKIDLNADEERQIIKALTNLYHNPEIGRRMGNKSKQYVKDTCNVEKTTKQYLDVIQNITGKSI